MSGGPVDLPSIAQGSVALNSAPLEDTSSAKATRYINDLYEARCAAQWASIGELARKVEKHAPRRRCLALAAKAGSRMFPSPSLQQFKLTEEEFGEHLSQALRRSDSSAVDILDATVCRAAMLLGVGRVQSALSQISEPLHRIAVPSKGTGVDAWIAVCVLQGTLVRGLCLERLNNTKDASHTYRSIISYLSKVVKLPSACPELHRWIEELLSRICLFFATENVAHTSQLGEAMASFHLLSQYLDGQSWQPLSSRTTFARQTPRQVWRAYFETLSKLIRDDLVYHPSPVYRDHDTLEHRGLLDDDDFTASRIRQRADLRRVQSNYETLLLKETKFPMANESNEEINSWVELVMGNFNVLCGLNWTNQELGAGPGGKAVVARNTLDILYSATTKTFHSTQILRHLFTVHSYLGEFEIAFKAFDSYVEIVTKGKARAEKSVTNGQDLDDDATAIRLAAEAIRVACRLGSEVAAEKALNISETLQKWIDGQKSESTVNGVGTESEASEGSAPKVFSSSVSPEILSLAYCAIGISQAQYARSTPLPASRTGMQQKAMENLRLSLDQGLDGASSVDTYFALSLLLAETRDTTGAIQTVKLALNDTSRPSDLGSLNGTQTNGHLEQSSPSGGSDVSKHIKRLSAWHLLAQLLCAREEFETASSCCALALEKLGGLSSLLQQSGGLNGPQQSFVRDNSQSTPARSQNTVDTMDNLEKQVLLEIKMTQLALSEVIDGPEAAVNEANELLALFARLFGSIDFDDQRKSRAGAIMSPPKSSSGTIRSIFGRPKSAKRAEPAAATAAAPAVPALPSKTDSAITTRPTTSTTTNPTIQVTNPTGATTLPPHPSDQDRKPKHNVLRKKSSSIRREAVTHANPSAEQADRKTVSKSQEAPESNHARVSFQNENRDIDESKDISGAQPLGQVSENLPAEAKPSPTGHELGQPPKQDTRLPVPQPHDRRNAAAPIEVELQEQRFKVSLFDDAKEAIKEAHKLVSGLEAEVLKQSSSIRQLQDQGWSRAKSVEELWADVFSEDGKLHQSQSLSHDAIEYYENALSYFPDHCEATVNLSDILLDIYCQVISSEKEDSLDLLIPHGVPMASAMNRSTAPQDSTMSKPAPSDIADPEPAELSRLACRDRAYGLLSSLTKLGSGWDNAEAWFVLARAYEESGQVDKAKEALWWTVHLEDTAPIRHWRNVNPGGYVL